VKVLRGAARPAGGRTLGRYVHYDYSVSGVRDMLTTWIPLADVPVAQGGLAEWAGGHRDRPRPLAGTKRGWAATDYRAGDVIIFYRLTTQRCRTGRFELRLSADFRWQWPGCPAPAEMVLGPASQPPELFSRLLCRAPGWEPLPAGLTLRPRAELAARPPGRFRLFTVHPAWRR
jgi:hypothetical protein